MPLRSSAVAACSEPAVVLIFLWLWSRFLLCSPAERWSGLGLCLANGPQCCCPSLCPHRAPSLPKVLWGLMHVSPPGIKIPESCVRKVLEELKQMDENVKRKHNQEQSPQFSLPLPMLSQPPDLTQTGPGVPLPRHSLCQDEILDLTCSPPSNSIPDVVMNPELGMLCLPSEPLLQPHQQHRLPFGFSHPSAFESPAPVLEGNVPLSSSLHEPLPLPHPAPLQTLQQQQQEDFVQQDGNINFREILEEMLRTFNGAHQENMLPQERQSVIQFSGPFPDF